MRLKPLICAALTCLLPAAPVVAQALAGDAGRPATFADLDRNNDGAISRVEWAASYAVDPPAQKGVEVVGPDGSIQILVPRPVLPGLAPGSSDSAAKARIAAREALALGARRPSMADAASAAEEPVPAIMDFEVYDRNGDNRIARAEWQSFQGPRPPDP
jgi:hypothetical protein